MSSQSTNSKKENALLLNTYRYRSLLPCFLKTENSLIALELYQAIRLECTHEDFPQIFVQLLIPYANTLYRSTYWKYFMSLHSNLKFKNQSKFDELWECMRKLTNIYKRNHLLCKYCSNSKPPNNLRASCSKVKKQIGNHTPSPPKVFWVKASPFSTERQPCCVS